MKASEGQLVTGNGSLFDAEKSAAVCAYVVAWNADDVCFADVGEACQGVFDGDPWDTVDD